MRISFIRNRKLYPYLISAALIFGLCSLICGINIWFSLLFTVVLGVSLFARIEFKRDLNPLFVIPIMLLCATLTFLVMQMIISAGIYKMNVIKFILNILFICAMQSLMYAFTGSIRASVLSVLCFSSALAIIDHLVVQTRSMEISFNDIYSVTTALSVAGGYSFILADVTKLGIFLAVIYAVIIFRTSFPRHPQLKLKLVSGVSSVSVIAVVAMLVSTSWGTSAINFVEKYWMYRASQYNGFYLNIIHTATATKVSVPNGYSPESLSELLAEFLGNKNTVPDKTGESVTTGPDTNEPPVTSGNTTDVPGTEPEKKLPNVIVIMEETFSDLQAVSQWMYENGYSSNLLETDVEVLSYFNSLDSSMPNVEKGWAMSSVFGGNTANSEFEFLTGNSMAFLPTNTVAYNLYLNEDNSFSIVDIFNRYGYYTVGMHPEKETNWSRNKIYSYFGFDESYFVDDFTDLVAEDYYRGHVSDAAVFNKIISLYENKEEGAPLFTFAVTMDNHGGYSTEGFEYTVNINGFTKFTGTQEYLSSIRATDEAIQQLIEYFSTADEETVIVIFGDHQPSLSTSFYQTFFGLADDSDAKLNQSKYVVPYLIWSNFDFESEDDNITSLNYLSGKLLDIIGLEKTEYMKFVSSLREEYPVVTAAGYWDNDGNFYPFESYPSDEVTLLRLYKYLQYNALFDSVENKLLEWFVLAENITPVTTPPSIGYSDEEYGLE